MMLPENKRKKLTEIEARAWPTVILGDSALNIVMYALMACWKHSSTR
ncbi:hypothetical protein PI125_g23917 [Phytophthora idaei]|nr:hypothetical protein PI125_g23917 [Phytophthora idaei]